MAALPATGPNAEQIQYWNEAGQRWVAQQHLLDIQIDGLGRLAIDRAALAGSEQVIDVGCGCGTTTLQLAQRLGPRGSVTGVDISAVMLERARQRAHEGGVTQVRFENVDAQTHAFPPQTFDVLFSRFGVMFFSDPAAAFANLRRALRPEGRLAFVCWRALLENPWMVVPLMAAAQHLTLPPPPLPGAPGPFAFADNARVGDILTRAGFRDIQFEAVDEMLSVGGGGDLDQTVEFLMHVGPLGALMRQPDIVAAVPQIKAAVREALTPFFGAEGVRMPGAAWIVTAHA